MANTNLKTKKTRLISTFLIIVYCFLLIKVLVLKDIPLIRVGSLMLNFGGVQERPANLTPFKTILPYLLGENGLLIGSINIIGNIALLVPIGFLFPLVYRAMTWKKTLILAVAVSFVIEGVQAALHVGIFDIDDVILNAFGVVIGFWIFEIFYKWLLEKKYKIIIITSITVITISIAVVYAIIPNGHPQLNPMPITENSNGLKNKTSKGIDPCNGTGGTGEIIDVVNNTMTMKGNNGVNQIIILTSQTKFKNSMGDCTKSDLKTGNRVTVVIDESETATFVFICK